LFEPFDAGHPARIHSVKIREGTGNEDTGDVVLVISHGNVTDTVIRLETSASYAFGDLVLHGKRAFIREEDGVVTKMVLIGGTLLQKGSACLTGKGSITGTVEKTMRKASGDPYDAFVTETEIDELKEFSCVLLDFHIVGN